jgi:ADP-ribosylglycohydrolase
VLLGQAAGDALGVGYEGRKEGRWPWKMIGGRSGFEPGEWTGDTEQAVIVATARSEPLAVADGLVDWYGGGPKDIEMGTAAVLSHAAGEPGRLSDAAREYAEVSMARPVPEGWDPSMTNGSLARTGPVCLPFLGDRERIVQAARDISDLTHADPYAGDACVLWSLAIERAVLDGDGYDVGGRGDDGTGLGGFDLRAEFERDCQLWLPVERRDFWSQTIAVACSHRGPSARNTSAVGAFMAALYAIKGVGDLVDGLRSAISGGGDTGTVAAIAGSLLGALYGAEGLMPKWRALLHGWPGLDADGLQQLAQEAADQPRSG